MSLPTTRSTGLKPSADVTPENFKFLCDAIYKDSGIVLDESKAYLVEARLMPLAREEPDGTLDGLCNLIRKVGGHALRARVVEAMMTNETLFFRDVKPFEGLEKHLLPEIIAGGRPDKTLRVWSAACSSGQEAYSLAMLWDQMRNPGWRLDILGTDLSEKILEKAEGGRYLQLEVNRGLPAKYLVKYLERDGRDWVIKPEIRKMARWKMFNLKDPMSTFGPFDIIFCRNVLIYFDQAQKSDILRRLRARLKRGGHLILGSSETTLGLDDGFERRLYGPAVFYQNPE